MICYRGQEGNDIFMCENTHKIIVEELIYFRKSHVTLANTEVGGRFLSANMTLQKSALGRGRDRSC